MYKPALILIFLFAFTASYAGEDKCASWTRLQELFARDPGFKTQFDELERQRQAAIEALQGQRTLAGTIYTIPVVVHIVYNASNPEQNISDAQVQSQIAVLNKDFRLLNSDKLSSSHPFASLAGDAGIEFCLASKDPSNNPTSGIVRKSTTVDGFTNNDKVKNSGTGGDNPWDPAQYLNIWICKMNGGTLGYSSFPGGPASVDGVVIAYNCFGTMGVLLPQFDRGRTTTHEMGHWLGLYHTWGDEDMCDADDEVDDTPLQAKATFGCPGGELTDACQPSSPGILYQDFMDYTDDACMNMFTAGQVTRMRATLLTQRSNFLTSDKCGSLSSVGQQPDQAIRIYPNPVTNYLYLENLPQSRSAYTVEVIDELGRVLKRADYTGAFIQMEVSDLFNGYYMVRVYNDERFAAEKILILH